MPLYYSQAGGAGYRARGGGTNPEGAGTLGGGGAPGACVIRLPIKNLERNRRLVGLLCDSSRCRRQQLLDRPLHRTVHLRYNCRYVSLGNGSSFGNVVSPNGFASGK